jgi:hypothetical protein
MGKIENEYSRVLVVVGVVELIEEAETREDADSAHADVPRAIGFGLELIAQADGACTPVKSGAAACSR